MNVRIIATILGIAAFSVSCSSKKDAQTEEKERVENVRTMTLQKTEVNRELELSTTLDNNVGNAGHLIDNVGYLKAAPHHKLNELFGSYVEINIFFKPFKGQFHIILPPC